MRNQNTPPLAADDLNRTGRGAETQKSSVATAVATLSRLVVRETCSLGKDENAANSASFGNYG